MVAFALKTGPHPSGQGTEASRKGNDSSAGPSGPLRPAAEQPALAGLAPRRRRRRVHAHEPAATDPIAHVVLDVQALHLGRDFDYLVDESISDTARPGALVRVRFAGRLVNGVVWGRAASSASPSSSLRWIERVLAPGLVPDELRRDIESIADAYGGTRANILRLAIPPRSATVDRDMGGIVRPGDGAGADMIESAGEQASVASSRAPGDDGGGGSEAGSVYSASALHAGNPRFSDSASFSDPPEFLASYGHAELLRRALVSGGFASFVLDCAPGPAEAERVLSRAVALSLSVGRSAVAVMPDMRATGRLARLLSGWGLRVGGPDAAGRGVDVVILSASMPPAQRYRAFRALSLGMVRGVIGTRAVMYAPVRGPGLFAIMDDGAYQQADGMMPYAQARGVLRLRARLHAGTFLAVGAARSAIGQRECDGGGEDGVSGPSTALRPRQEILDSSKPDVTWLTRDSLEKTGDPAPGARVPRGVARLLSQVLREGPVLLSVPRDLAAPVLACGRCHRRARCRLCTGPLVPSSAGAPPRCRWCGAIATAWSCPHCSGRHIAPIRVGSTGTATELRRMFPGTPFVVSAPMGSRGFVPWVPQVPAVVVAPPGFEPLVRDAQGRVGAYRAAVILDAWTSLYSQSLDARQDVLAAWMRVAGLASPADGTGRVVVVGQADEGVVASLKSWDCTILASADLEERREACLPPAVTAAYVWGRRSAVEGLLRRTGAVDGDLATLETDAGDVPAVLGPRPIPPPRTLDERELEATRDRVGAVVRAPHARRAELVRRLRDQTAWHVAAREPGELRFRVDPKDLLP
ncbi:primosomal protein N' [uncultured Bifidobacterium sp.]|uniref:primosomal protein N' family DNA-binding protein n=1 Tax=uncultured Bifidobacterium sp. TaxID=165187 RepID=UPI0028DCE2BA|nr:primosomal protein N' [uncultured Bifidobacterium sp.]